MSKRQINLFLGEKYTCAFDWPDSCGVQAGDNGMVFTRHQISDVLPNPEKAAAALTGQLPHYRTAYFEAFPDDPPTFIRGEGKTVLDAETDAWEQYQRYAACDHPAFERRGYENGAGFCTQCGMFNIEAFDPLTTCRVCGTPTNWSQDNQGEWWCESCNVNKPDDRKEPWELARENWLTGLTPEQLAALDLPFLGE